MRNELLVSVLKSYVPAKDYDLHDWESIISRSWRFNENVTVYPLVYADLYLTGALEFYAVDPKQPGSSFMEDKVLPEHELLVDVLKSYVPAKDYDLHDWEEIIRRREQYNDNVFIYKLVYADIYLTTDLEFYSVDPKQPNMSIFKSMSEDENAMIIDAISNYIPSKYLGDVDWMTVISRREQIHENIYKYTINNISICLDDGLELVEYGNMHIIDDDIFYDFELDGSEQYDGYILFGEL